MAWILYALVKAGVVYYQTTYLGLDMNPVYPLFLALRGLLFGLAFFVNPESVVPSGYKLGVGAILFDIVMMSWISLGFAILACCLSLLPYLDGSHDISDLEEDARLLPRRRPPRPSEEGSGSWADACVKAEDKDPE